MAMADMEISPATKMTVDFDFDDDVRLCFRRKRKSSTKIVVVDDDDDRGKKKETRKEKQSAIDSDKECESDFHDEGELDISGSAFVEVDGPTLKERNKARYNSVVRFAYGCRQKNRLRLFCHLGYPGPIACSSATGRCLTDKDRGLAVIAVKEYEKVNQNAKLKLRDLMKLHVYFVGCFTYYMTFSAEDVMTGEIKTYQAALAYLVDEHLLGLFREVVEDKVLAILSVKGVDEDLTADQDEYWREDRLAKESKP